MTYLMLTFHQNLYLLILVSFCESLKKKFFECLERHIITKLSHFMITYFPPKVFNVCTMLVYKLNEYCIKVCDYLSHKYPTIYFTLEKYSSVYFNLTKKNPTLLLWLKQVSCALFLIVICSSSLLFYIVFVAFIGSNLMIMYLSEINPHYSIRHPVLYWLFLTICLLIIVCSLIFFAQNLIIYIKTRTTRKSVGKGPTGEGPQGSPGGPQGDNDPDPYMPQDSERDKSKKGKGKGKGKDKRKAVKKTLNKMQNTKN